MRDDSRAESRSSLQSDFDLFSFHQHDSSLQKLPANSQPLDAYSFHQGKKSPWLPDIHIDGVEPQQNQQPQEAGVERDSQNRISKITYPGGKVREFGRDTDGQLNSVRTKDASGESRLVKDDGKWFAEVSGKKLPLPGNVELSPNGAYSLPLDAKSFKTEKIDGSISIEKVNASGARVAKDTEGKLERITRKDGSSVEANYGSGTLSSITETSKDGKQVNWKRQGDVWTSDTQPPKQRLNYSLEENGNCTFTGTDGLKHIIRATGNELIEGPGKGKFAFDDQGRIQSIEYGDGKTQRKFGYDSDSSSINRVTLEDKTKNKSTTFERQGNSDTWTKTDAAGKKLGTWKGEASLSVDGIYSEKSLKSKTQDRAYDPTGDDEDPDREKDDVDDGEDETDKDKTDESDDTGRGRCNSGANWMDPNWSGWYDFGKKDSDTTSSRRFEYSDPSKQSVGEESEEDGIDSSEEEPDEKEADEEDAEQPEQQDKKETNEEDAGDKDEEAEPKEADDGDKDEEKEPAEKEGSDDDTDQSEEDSSNCNPWNWNRNCTDGQDEHDRQNEQLPGKSKPDGVWHSYKPDGSVSTERVTENGSKAAFDKNGSLKSIVRTDGSAVETVYKGKRLSQVIESNSNTGEKVTWSLQKKGDWTSDSAKYTEKRRNMKFNNDGDMTYNTADGALHTVKLDAASKP